MVENSVSDGKRIAQLLASELTGLETGPLERVTVSDAAPDAMPSDGGTFAYRISADEAELATVTLYPEYAELAFHTEPAEIESRLEVAGEPATASVTSGAEVKDAVDLIRETVSRSED